MLNNLIEELNGLKDDSKAKILQRFFKAKKGGYNEGDIFLGINVSMQREIAKKYPDLSLGEIQVLMDSKFHEHRMTGLIILVRQYKKSKKDKLKQREIFQFYLKNTHNVNNWDLVDISAPSIVGDFLSREGTDLLKSLAKSENLWERRISIVATYSFIKKRILGETLVIADMLINDKHDLIHKAVGWMLREVGKQNLNVLEIFLETRHEHMPRTMLRYAIEKFPEDKRKFFMQKSSKTSEKKKRIKKENPVIED